jgi:hypothetical protein
MDYETKGWNIGDSVYYFDIRNTSSKRVSQIMLCKSSISGVDRIRLYLDDGDFLHVDQAYRTLEELKAAVLKQVDDECRWLKCMEAAKP